MTRPKGPRPQIEFGTLINGVDFWYVSGAHVAPSYECPHASDVLNEPNGNPCRVIPLVIVLDGLDDLRCVSCVVQKQHEKIIALETRIAALETEGDGGCSFPGMTIVPRG